MDPITGTLATVASLGNLGGSIYSGKNQAKAQREANDLQRQIYQEQVAAQEPWRQAGLGALSDLRSLMSDPSSIENSAAYQFRLGEGQKALERNLAARGGTLGGGALKELTRYGQGMASDEFTNQFNRLASIAGLGQSATNTIGSYAGNYGNNAAEGLTALGNIKASSYLGGASALSSGIGDYMNYNLMRDVYGVDSPQPQRSSGMQSPMAWEGWGGK